MLDSANPTAGPAPLLADYTTIRLGGPARRLVPADTEADLVELVTTADAAGVPVLVLGGGSNLVVADEGFDGDVVRVAHLGLDFDRSGADVTVRVAAGEVWDDVVAACVEAGLAGLECLSGIPGLTGATPIQNVGAYGAEIAELVTGVRVFDRRDLETTTLHPADCGFGYRTSALKGDDRYLVLSVELRLRVSPTSAPIRYAQLADELGVELDAVVPADVVRAAVLALRRSKGMIIDPADPDSVSAGSFFTNPVVDSARLPAGAPNWPVGTGLAKVPAAWLIERAGFPRGFGQGQVGVSTKHTLALVNRGGATTSELLELARTIRDGVRRQFAITLDVEPALIGVQL